VEFNDLDPRTGGVLDLTEVPLWPLEELRIERGATEIRVYMRTWRVDRTTPYTRTDISTGDQQTNLYRGFFGKRWNAGEGVQVGAQQYGTTPSQRFSPSSDGLSLLGRAGWARGGWSFDGFALRTNRNRGAIFPQLIRGIDLIDTVPKLQSSRTDAYLRAGYGDPESGLWMQAMASALSYTITNNNSAAVTADTIPDSTRFQAQYLLTGGLSLGPLRLSGAERLRVQNGTRVWSPSGRFELVTGPLALSAFADGPGQDSIGRVEVAARLTPLSFISIVGTAGRSSERFSDWGTSVAPLRTDSTTYANFLRAEAAIRVFGLWLGGGVVRRDSLQLIPPRVFGPQYVAVESPSATGFTAKIDGRIYRALRANIVGIRWNDSAAFYQPRYQTRSEIYLATNWLSRFPSGNFGVLASLVHTYRSKTYFPISTTAAGVTTTSVTSVPDSRIYDFHLEIRIVSAILSYQFRNVRGDPYELVPGYLMPRLNQFYGVRWEFWN
jgi:hypothetical protein